MSTSHRTKLILHLSDFRISDSTRVTERADAIINGLIAKSEPARRFDFIAVTGDIKDRTANPTSAYEKATFLLKRLGDSLLRDSDQARILIVPGNHDWCKESGFQDYNRFVQHWYAQNGIAHCLKSADDNEGAPVAYLMNHREDGVVFLLLNSYWENTQLKGRLVTGRVCESQRAAFERHLRTLFPDSSECPPKLALMHQHLIPTRSYPDRVRRMIFSQDYPATIEWLSKQQTVITLHGPPPGYALLRTDEILTAQAKRRLGTELMVLGTGACGVDDGKHDDKNQFQAIVVNLRPRRFLESTIERTWFHWDGENWVSSPISFNSHQTFSAFQKRLVEAEQFTCDQIHENMKHPLRSEPADDWFWNHYNDVWKDLNPNESPPDGETPLHRKELFLDRLVSKLKEYNSSRSIFELLPFQLDAIYTYAAIFFGNEDIEEAAVREFKTKPWQSWLRFNDISDYARWSHLDWANWIIADQLRAWAIKNMPECVGIVDLGYGLLRTIDSIGRNIPDAPLEQRYLGIDLSSDQLRSAKKMLAEATNASTFFNNPKTKKFQQIGDYFVTYSGRRFWRRDNPLLPALSADGFNVFVCVYAMHHCSNMFRVRKSLMDGSFFRFIVHSARSGVEHLKKHLGSQILDRVDAGMRDEFIRSLVLLSQEVYSHDSQLEEPNRVRHHLVQSSIERVLELAFPDTQLEIYKMVFDTMRDGGLLCIADPNGMSRTFNRQEIFRNAAIAIAHFSDWTDAVSTIHKAGFQRIRVFRQIRLNSLQVRRVAIPDESIEAILAEEGESEIGRIARLRSFNESILPERFEQFKSEFHLPAATVSSLEILDQHMGYILIAEKPKTV